MFSNKEALLLDMNSTFMFGEDSFGISEDFSRHYHEIGGSLSKEKINTIIRLVYDYLDVRYPDEKYRHNFPSIENTIDKIITHELDQEEISKIIDTFAFHEMGYIPDEYIEALHRLNDKYQLSVVIDIWSPKRDWLKLFVESGIDKLFSESSFSSDHGMVKPSPKPFELVIAKLGVRKEQALVVGDSIRRDLGGAKAAGIDCVLVGKAKHNHAMECYKNLIEFSYAM
ncbi:hypothetical protein MNBD_GAMMA04-1163 [hydrothermal vent metagenome]|uniref:Uncharacterized protein n=1 Tax=hydrothermal vent metagenome TaxID=652676 RepID=A0A3B0VWX1_9ZZZZ